VFSGQSIIEQDVPGVWKGRHYSFDAFPLVDQDGNISNIALITHDVSEMKKIEEDLLQSLQKEKDLSELKSRFVSTASHEFRTPLSTILSSAFLLKNYTQTEDQVKREKHIHRIESSVNLLNDILNDFLSVEKMEEGKVGVKYCRFNIRELLNAVCNEMNPVLKPGQHFNYYHSGKFMVSLDPSLIKNSLINLLSNAIKFSGGDQPIEIHSRVDENNIMLSVKDHGIGISEQDQAHLFERFFRAANAAAIKGTGLGLHLVNKYVSLMEGRLEFKSELNAGSEFIIKLPVKKNDP
jgi:signal transduction histidine kinase